MKLNFYRKPIAFFTLLVCLGVIFLFSNCQKPVSETQVTEFAVYQIKKEKLNQLAEYKIAVDTFLTTQKGFISKQYFQDQRDPSVLVDVIQWNSLEEAEMAGAAAEKNEALVPFFEATEKVIYFGHHRIIKTK